MESKMNKRQALILAIMAMSYCRVFSRRFERDWLKDGTKPAVISGYFTEAINVLKGELKGG